MASRPFAFGVRLRDRPHRPGDPQRQEPLELRDRGLMYHGLDCARPALMDLERYLELDPEGEGSDAIRQLVGQLHQQVPSIH